MYQEEEWDCSHLKFVPPDLEVPLPMDSYPDVSKEIAFTRDDIYDLSYRTHIELKAQEKCFRMFRRTGIPVERLTDPYAVCMMVTYKDDPTSQQHAVVTYDDPDVLASLVVDLREHRNILVQHRECTIQRLERSNPYVGVERVIRRSVQNGHDTPCAGCLACIDYTNRLKDLGPYGCTQRIAEELGELEIFFAKPENKCTCGAHGSEKLMLGAKTIFNSVKRTSS